MNILIALGQGLLFGLIMSIPIWLFNYYLCKRFDKLIAMTEEISSKYSKWWYNRYVSLIRLTYFYNRICNCSSEDRANALKIRLLTYKMEPL